MPVVAIADMFALAGRRGELAALLAEAEREATAEPGCIRYTFAASLADPDRLILLSAWRDQASMDAHYSARAFADFQFSLDGLLARPSEMTVYTVSASARPAAFGPMDPRDAD